MRAADRLHDAYTAILLCLETAAQGEKSDAIRNLEAMKDSPTPRALSLLGGILFNSGLEDNQEQAFISLRKGFLRRNYSSCAVLYTDYLLQRLRRLALDGKERAKNSPQGAEPVLLRAELLRVADMGIASAQFAAAKVLLTGAFATGADPAPGARYLEKAVRAGHDGAIVFAAWTRSLWPAFKLDHDELLGHLTAGADWLKPNSLAAAFIPMYPARIWLAPNLDPDTTQMMDMSLDSLRHVAGQRHVPLAEAFLLVRDTRFLARDLAGRPQAADGDAAGTIIARCQAVLGHARVYADIEALFELLRLLPALRSSCTPKELVLAGSILAQGMALGAPEGGSLDDVEEALYSLLQEFGIARGVAARALTHLDDALPV